MTELGIVTDSSELQITNAQYPIDVIELGIVAVFDPEQKLKASTAISVKEPRMVIDVNFLCDQKKNTLIKGLDCLRYHAASVLFLLTPNETSHFLV